MDQVKTLFSLEEKIKSMFDKNYLRDDKLKRLSSLAFMGKLFFEEDTLYYDVKLFWFPLFFYLFCNIGIDFKRIPENDLYDMVKLFFDPNRKFYVSPVLEQICDISSSFSEAMSLLNLLEERRLEFLKLLECGTIGLMRSIKRKNRYKEIINSENRLYLLKDSIDEFSEMYEEPEVALRKLEEILLTSYKVPSVMGFPLFSFSSANIKGFDGLFMKWVNPCRVEFSDYEIMVAEKMKKYGLNVPSYYGVLTLGDNAYLLAQKIEGVDLRRFRIFGDGCYIYDDSDLNICGFCGSGFSGPENNRDVLDKIIMSYKRFGEEMRKAVCRGVFFGDCSLRNIMVSYENGDILVYFIDFEKTFVKESLTKNEIENIIACLYSELSPIERMAFEEGFSSYKS